MNQISGIGVFKDGQQFRLDDDSEFCLVTVFVLFGKKKHLVAY